MIKGKIQSVERNLLTANNIKDQFHTHYNITNRMAHYHVPGVSIAVINNYQIEWALGYGVQDTNTKNPVTTNTIFQAGSISKPVAALAVLALVEKGILTLDQDINELLLSWNLEENEFTKEKKVTLRRILSHTAGLTVHGFWGYDQHQALPSLRQILDGLPPANSKPVRVDTVPGTQVRYSGGGYVLLQYLLEETTGMTFESLMQQTVFHPLKMNKSSFIQPPSTPCSNNIASGHSGDTLPIEDKWRFYPESAAAGLWTTPTDLAKFVIELMLSFKGLSNKIISKDMVKEMLTVSSENYGLGLIVEKVNSGISFMHGGSNVVFNSFLVAYPETGQGAIVMTNGFYGDLLMMEIIRSIALVYGWSNFQSIEKSILMKTIVDYTPYEGRYQRELASDSVFYLDVKQVGSDLSIELMKNGILFLLYPESRTRFFSLEMEYDMEFIESEEKSVFNALRIGLDMIFKKCN